MTDTTSPPLAQVEQGDAIPSSRDEVNRVGILLGYVLGGTGWLACFAVATQVGGEIWLNILFCLFGSTIGWWAGILISPDPTELGRFSSFRKAVSAFLTGFVLAKLDLLFQGAVAHNLASSPVFIGRIFLFATTTMICAQFTYVARHNLRPASSEPANDRAARRISFPQRLLRIAGCVLALTGLVFFLYLNYLRNLNTGQNLVVAMIGASALTFLASSTSIRDWLFTGAQSAETPSSSPGS
jgi:hypothetical protein